MVRIPTAIPKYVKQQAVRYWGQPFFDRLWQLLLVMTVIIALAVAPLGALGTAIVGILFSVVFADDIKQLWMDIWNRNFWIWRV